MGSVSPAAAAHAWERSFNRLHAGGWVLCHSHPLSLQLTFLLLLLLPTAFLPLLLPKPAPAVTATARRCRRACRCCAAAWGAATKGTALVSEAIAMLLLVGDRKREAALVLAQSASSDGLGLVLQRETVTGSSDIWLHARRVVVAHCRRRRRQRSAAPTPVMATAAAPCSWAVQLCCVHRHPCSLMD